MHGIARAKAGINIALVKYWGKRDSKDNLPAVGSLSLTLSPWGTDTTVHWCSDLDADVFTLNDEVYTDQKVLKVLNYLRQLSGVQLYAKITSQNSVPTAAGLASSASGMAALSYAAWVALERALGTSLPSQPYAIDLPIDLINAVRIGSGSAPRSLLGGFVRLNRDGKTLQQLCPETDWSVSLVVAVVNQGPKEISSRVGMERTRTSSPYYSAWVESHEADLDEATAAIESRDLDRLGTVMEHSTFKMHACMWASKSPLRYIKGISLDLIDEVIALRSEGYSAWVTMDAGPHVKILCSNHDAQRVATRIKAHPKVLRCLILSPGQGIHLCD